ncbi:LamG-like jellyroll fold domain-containing protein [Agromyces mediolanus]|uniref:LamG-like jellyroll fold domain-containing protein n=1 Tax=Agromyces mediolanus TaxID=41986 RepID=UPI0038373180
MKWWIAGATALAVVVSGTVVVSLGLQRGTDDPAAVDCSVAEAADADAAAVLAAECDVDVEITDVRTPWARTFATADGPERLEVSAMPNQVERDGEWVELDRTLVVAADGESIEVAAPAYELELNAGDATVDATRPLGVIEYEGERLEVWFPLALPEPELDGPRATYALDEGVRLEVTVSPDATGFTPIVVLDSPAAAARFEAALVAARTASGDAGVGMDVAFRTVVSDGLRVVTTAEGGVEVLDEGGEVRFSAPPSLMWDASGDASADDSGEPAPSASSGPDPETGLGDPELAEAERGLHPMPGDRVANMPVTVVDGSVVVSPDPVLLADPATVWPVRLDPSFSGKGPAEWILVRTGGFTSSIYKWTDPMDGGNGRCTDSSCNAVFTARLSWEFGGLDTIRNMTGADVISAQFRVNGVHSYNCTAATTDLYLTNSLSASTTWANLGQGAVLGSVTGSQRSSCSTAGWKEFNATNGLKQLADNNWATVTMGLKSRDESSMAGWKRFAHNATIAVTYNRAPNKPSNVRLTNPARACVAGAGRPQITSTEPSLAATVTDPDGGNVQAHFQIVQQGTNTEVWNSGTLLADASGSEFTAKVPKNTLVHGKSYQYRVTATDGSKWSGWSTAVCEFTVDTVSPAAPTIVPVQSGYPAVYLSGVERGGVGVQGAFTISAPGAATIKYGDTNPPTKTSTTTPITHEVTPGAPGLRIVYAQAFDVAGNPSPVTSYRYDVAFPEEDGVWTFDDATQDDTAADTSSVLKKNPLLLDEALWTTGPRELFGSRDGDGALSFDGVDDSAQTVGPVVDTSKSFTVSAFVRLDAAALDKGKSYTALGQDGVTQSGFFLQYHPSCGAGGTGCWRFMMPSSDSTTPATVAAKSPMVVRGDEWVLLVAEYNKAAKKVALWTCPVGTPENPTTAVPVRAEASRTVAPWKASGPFTVGRTLYNGVKKDFWPGEIDDVRAFSDEVVAESKIRRICQGAEAIDFGGDKNAVDPTEKD